MRTRLLYANDTTLSSECKRDIERALMPFRPTSRKGLDAWQTKCATLCSLIESTLRDIPPNWAWPQAPVVSEARAIARRLYGILREVEASPSFLDVLERSYFAAFPMCGTGPAGHDAHAMAANGKTIQFGEVLWRTRKGVEAYLQETDTPARGRPGYDDGLLWLVAEIHARIKKVFPRVPMGQGNKSAFPAIVEAVLSHQVVLEDSEKERHYTKKATAVKYGRARDIINAALTREKRRVLDGPPSRHFTTTTTTTTTTL